MSTIRAEPLEHRAVTARADDHEIDDRNAEQVADRAQPARQRDVLRARRWIAGRMVVDEHRAGRRHAHERPEDLARMDLDAVHAAAANLDDVEQAVADVDAEREK